MHYMLGVILQLHQDSRHAQAIATLVQPLKVLQQVAIDNRTWSTAVHLFLSVEPLGKEHFGGGKMELAAVHQYMKGLRTSSWASRRVERARTTTRSECPCLSPALEDPIFVSSSGPCETSRLRAWAGAYAGLCSGMHLRSDA